MTTASPADAPPTSRPAGYNRRVEQSSVGGCEVELLVGEPCLACASVRAALRALAGDLAISVREVAVEEHPDLRGRYGLVLPVVRVEGRAVLSGDITAEELRAELVRALGPAPLGGMQPEEALFLPVLHCPACEGPLEGRPRAVACLACNREYERRDGVLHLMTEPEEPSGRGVLDWVLKVISFRLPPE